MAKVASIDYKTWKIDIYQITSSTGSNTYKFMIQKPTGENVDVPPEVMNIFFKQQFAIEHAQNFIDSRVNTV